MRLHRSTVSAPVVFVALVFALFPAAMPAAGADANDPVHHLVLFKFGEDVPFAKVREILTAFEELPSKIPGIQGFQWGVNNSPEGLDKGFTHGFIVTFENAAARDRYLPHPEHAKFGGLVGPALAGVFVVDFPIPEVPPVAEPGRVHHMVFFKYKDGTAPDAIDRINSEFSALQGKIAGLLRYQAGVNDSPEGLEEGFTHGYLLTFLHERARDDYLTHPAHKAFGSILGPHLEEPLVFDFTVLPSAQRVFVTHGLEPFRVYQRSENGVATIRFGGIARDEGPIEARLRAGRRTVKGHDWKVVGVTKSGRFEASLDGVPTGGEYTVEVRLRDALGNVSAHTEVADILVGDIWILGGQSNMEGYANLDGVEAPHPLVHCFTMGHRWELAKEPLHWLVDSPDPVHSGRWFRRGVSDESGRRKVRADFRARRTKGAGLGLPFAKELVARTGVPVGLIASAHGGTSMLQWDPSGRNEAASRLYGSLLKQVRNAGGKVRGVLWYQGESDANPDDARLFLDRFKGLVAAFREDLKSPQLPFLYVQIGRHVTNASAESNAAWDRIQELQRIAEREIPGTSVISVMDLPIDDPIHVGVDGLKRAGKRLAKIAHRDVFGAEGIERGPRLAGAKVDPGGRVIRLTYNEVNGRLLPGDKVEGFAIVGADGKKIPTLYKAYVDPKATNVVILELYRPLPADAKLHYALGRESVCNLVDEEDMAAHAFGPVEIDR